MPANPSAIPLLGGLTVAVVSLGVLGACGASPTVTPTAPAPPAGPLPGASVTSFCDPTGVRVFLDAGRPFAVAVPTGGAGGWSSGCVR